MAKKKDFKSARDIKKDQVATLSEKIARAKTIVFSDYQGLSSEAMNALRKKVKAAGGEFLIAKNSLLKIALNKTGRTVETEQLEGATAALFAYQDEVAPLRQIAESQKALGTPKYKFGFFGTDILDQSAVDVLSKIPPKDALQAKLVGSLASPIYGIVSVLNANLRNLVYALNSIAESKTTNA